MAPRRGLRAAKSVNNINYSKLSITDVLCPICRYILIQPVTLPCNHDFCTPCFEGTLANANLTCPLCRVRFGSWHRIAKKDKKLVNVQLWDVLRDKFPKQVENRLQGIEENLEEEAPIKLTTQGEIRREYEVQKHKQQVELEKQKREEEKASAELIKQLQQQEEYEKTVQEEKLRLDEQMARQLAKEMGLINKNSKNESAKKKSSIDKYIRNMKSSNAEKQENKTDAKKVPQYLNNIINKEKSNKQKNLMNFTIEITDNSNDSIENECWYFKPIDHRNIPPSKIGTVLKVPAVMKKVAPSIVGTPNKNINFSPNYNSSAFARFEMTSPILGVTSTSATNYTVVKNTPSRKRKLTDMTTAEQSKVSRINTKLNLPDTRKIYKDAKNIKTPNAKCEKLAQKRRSSIRKSNAEITVESKVSPYKMTLRDRKISLSPFRGFEASEIDAAPILFNGHSGKDLRQNQQMDLMKKQQEKKDLEFAKKLQMEFNKERYSTRSSITCRTNLKKSRQTTLTEIMSTSKCK